jgi:hypothetical protein
MSWTELTPANKCPGAHRDVVTFSITRWGHCKTTGAFLTVATKLLPAEWAQLLRPGCGIAVLIGERENAGRLLLAPRQGPFKVVSSGGAGKNQCVRIELPRQLFHADIVKLNKTPLAFEVSLAGLVVTLPTAALPGPVPAEEKPPARAKAAETPPVVTAPPQPAQAAARAPVAAVAPTREQIAAVAARRPPEPALPPLAAGKPKPDETTAFSMLGGTVLPKAGRP